jgi:hypothetical protein
MFACKLAGWLILLLACYFPYEYGRMEGYGDFKKIRRNGSQDSLKETWHRQNAIRRGVVLATGIALFFGLLNWLLRFDLCFLAAYSCYAVAMFGHTFSTTLNCKRNLPRYYVSHDPRASKTDQFMIRGAAYFSMQPQAFNRLVHVGSLLLSALALAVVVYFQV